jgi:hypothetical protein
MVSKPESNTLWRALPLPLSRVHGDIHVAQEVLGFVPPIQAPDGSPILALISTSLPSNSTRSLNASPIRLATEIAELLLGTSSSKTANSSP